MVEHFGLQVVQAYMQHVQDNAEEAVRRVIDALTDGEFEYAMDNGARVRVSIRIDKQARAARIDFTGTSPQQPNNFNAPVPVTRAAVLYVFRTLVNDEIPMNAGCLKPLQILVPEAIDAEAAVPGRGRRRQRRDVAGRHGLPVRCARRARGQPGHDEQLHVRRRRAPVLRDHRGRLRRRTGLRRHLGRPDAHDELASHRSGSAGMALPGAAGGLSHPSRLGWRRPSSWRRRQRTSRALPAADDRRAARQSSRRRSVRARGWTARRDRPELDRACRRQHRALRRDACRRRWMPATSS